MNVFVTVIVAAFVSGWLNVNMLKKMVVNRRANNSLDFVGYHLSFSAVNV